MESSIGIELTNINDNNNNNSVIDIPNNIYLYEHQQQHGKDNNTNNYNFRNGMNYQTECRSTDELLNDVSHTNNDIVKPDIDKEKFRGTNRCFIYQRHVGKEDTNQTHYLAATLMFYSGFILVFPFAILSCCFPFKDYQSTKYINRSLLLLLLYIILSFVIVVIILIYLISSGKI